MNKKVLIVDVGNSAIEFAIYEDGNLQYFLGFFHFPNEIKTAEKQLLAFKEGVGDAMIFSVVPSVNKILIKIIKKAFNVEAKVFDWGNYKLEMKNPNITEPIGADLLADIVEAKKSYGGPCLIVDLGTITKLLYVDKQGSFEGLSLIPGLETTVKSFSVNTELLPELKSSTLPKGRLGLNTIESMIHGAYYSTIYYVKEVLKSIGDKDCKLVITGGNLRYVKDEFKDAIIEPMLTLNGMAHLYMEIVK